MIRTYKYKLLPTKAQHVALEEILESQRQLYNAALEERIDAYKKNNKTISLYDQCASLTILRKDEITKKDFSSVPANLQRGTLIRLDRAYKAFFDRVKTEKRKAGFPRFKSRKSFKSISFSEFSGIRLIEGKIQFKGMPGKLRIHLHRDLPVNPDIRTCYIKREIDGWKVGFTVKLPDVEQKSSIENIVGIDVGLASFAVLSDGQKIENPRHTKKYEKELRRRQRHLSRCKKGSNGRRKARIQVARLHQNIQNARMNFLHHASRQLINSYDLIAVEALQVKNMMKNHNLAKSIADVSWSTFVFMLSYKAESAGKIIVKVDPRNTSLECSSCHEKIPKTLADRTHNCTFCGLSLCRDHNAALNILNRAVLRPEVANVIQ